MTSAPGNWCSPNQAPPPPRRGPLDDPRLRPGVQSAVCALGWQPLLLRGLLVDLLRRHFADSANVADDLLRRHVWREGDRAGILIETVYQWTGDKVGLRPAVLVRDNGRHNSRRGIADYVGTDEQGNRLYQTYWVGSHTLFCLHESAAAADILAAEVEQELTGFAQPLIEYLDLDRWQVTEAGAPAPVEEARESWAVPLTVAWVYHTQWRVAATAPTLGGLSLRAALGDAVVR